MDFVAESKAMHHPGHPHLDTIARAGQSRGLRPADPLVQPLAEARRSALEYQTLWNDPLPDQPGALSVATTIAGPFGTSVDLRIHYPDHRRDDLPVLLYFHGGGFALNSVDTHERLMRLLGQRAGVAVVGVGYGLAPELRFPGQLHQALAAVSWLRRDGGRWGLDADRLAVGGDSAGGNLALALTLLLKERRQPLPRFGLLLYGMFSADLATASHRDYGRGGFGLTTQRMDWFWSAYLADNAQRDNPLAAPLLADHHGLPPHLLIAAGLDCLRDDSVALHDRFRQAGVDSRLSIYDGVPHSFMQMSAHLPPADAAITEAAQALALHLATSDCLAAE